MKLNLFWSCQTALTRKLHDFEAAMLQEKKKFNSVHVVRQNEHKPNKQFGFYPTNIKTLPAQSLLKEKNGLLGYIFITE